MKITYNGVDLGQYIDGYTKINRNIGSGWTNTLQDSPIQGADFITSKTNSKTITIECLYYGFTSDFAVKRRGLAEVLNTGEPCPLVFDDEPNLCYMAVIDGDQGLDEAFIRGTGTLTFIVPSGIAESLSTATLSTEDSSATAYGSITQNSDGSMKLLLNNNGTLPAYPKFKITHHSDNGYIGIVGQNGVMELGSQDQTSIDTVTMETTKVESQWLLNSTKLSQASNFTSFAGTTMSNPQNSQLKTTGALAFKSDGLRISNMGTAPTSGTWLTQGGMMVWDVPVDDAGITGSANFTCDFNIWAQATQLGQTGLIQVLLCDANNKLLAGLGLYKDDKKGNAAQIQLYTGGNNQKTWKTFGFDTNNGGHGDGKQANPNLYFNSATGGMTIQKKAGMLYFTFSNRGGTYSINIPELANTQCSKALVYIGQLKGRNTSSQMITQLTLRQFKFQKNDVTKVIDTTTDPATFIPADVHHYGNGEIVTVDMNEAKIYRHDGQRLKNDEMITGSTFFSIPPGQSEVDLYFSDEMETAPDVEISWNERYI